MFLTFCCVFGRNLQKCPEVEVTKDRNPYASFFIFKDFPTLGLTYGFLPTILDFFLLFTNIGQYIVLDFWLGDFFH